MQQFLGIILIFLKTTSCVSSLTKVACINRYEDEYKAISQQIPPTTANKTASQYCKFMKVGLKVIRTTECK